MNRSALALVALSAILTAVANITLRVGVLKAGGLSLSRERFWSDAVALTSQPMFVVGFICYGLAAVVWLSVLPRVDISVSYPLLVGLAFVLVALGSVIVFHEGLPWDKVAGMALILAGVALVAQA
ncbi:MAG: hypothetical protein IH968_01195 [Gemmatimonadetes bacterium]|nr:hypothetical protein [Gemmatimonadota bacterium]